jgi:hypothetical protein
MATQQTIHLTVETRIAQLRRRGQIFTAAMVVLAAIGLIGVYTVTTRHPETDDAEMFANYIGIAPVVEGPILHLNVADNQRVNREICFSKSMIARISMRSIGRCRIGRLLKDRSSTSDGAFRPKCMR